MTNVAVYGACSAIIEVTGRFEVGLPLNHLEEALRRNSIFECRLDHLNEAVREAPL